MIGGDVTPLLHSPLSAPHMGQSRQGAPRWHQNEDQEHCRLHGREHERRPYEQRVQKGNTPIMSIVCHAVCDIQTWYPWGHSVGSSLSSLFFCKCYISILNHLSFFTHADTLLSLHVLIHSLYPYPTFLQPGVTAELYTNASLSIQRDMPELYAKIRPEVRFAHESFFIQDESEIRRYVVWCGVRWCGVVCYAISCGVV